MFYGKVVAGLLGLALAGWPGLLVGLLAGHWFDRGLQHTLGFANPERLARIQETYFATSFQLLGHIAKADGRISEQEVQQTEALMRQLGITGEQRSRAIELFKQGAAADFSLENSLSRFNQDCGGAGQLALTLLTFLIGMALADGTIDASERDALWRVAQLLEIGRAQFERLLQMVEAQSHFHDHSRQAGSPGQSRPEQLADAYRALGVEAGVSDRELKHAYRRLMSEHHPDKLIARGVPESMMKVATAKAQEIQAAYELIRESRGS